MPLFTVAEYRVCPWAQRPRTAARHGSWTGGLLSARQNEATFKASARQKSLEEEENQVVKEINSSWFDAFTALKNIDVAEQLAATAQLSWVEIKPASKGRNDPASGARIRPHEKRGIFLSNKPDINELMRACLEEKCRLTQILVAGSFRPLLAGL